jgi:hypothetical protein
VSETPITDALFREDGPVLRQILGPTETKKIMMALERELNVLQGAGIAEIAVRNPNVTHYMNHWEERALKAEQCLQKIANLFVRNRTPENRLHEIDRILEEYGK